jgi:hypothetical protein
VAIATLVIWLLTASAGVSLLLTGQARKAASAGEHQQAATVTATRTPAGSGPPTAAQALAGPLPSTRVVTPPGEHPLLEFTHPALGVLGAGCWLGFVSTGYQPIAWASFAVLVLTICAGLGWLLSGMLARRRGLPARARFRPRLIMTHGAAATATFALVILTALSASHA